MKEIQQAIYTKGITSSSFATSIGNRLYFGKAPQNPTYPFVVFINIPNRIDNNIGAENDNSQTISKVKIQFNIHSNQIGSSNEAETIGGYLKDLYKFYSVPITGYNTFKMLLTNEFGAFYFDDTQEWIKSFEYEFYVQHT